MRAISSRKKGASIMYTRMDNILTPGWTLAVHPHVESAYTPVYGRMNKL